MPRGSATALRLSYSMDRSAPKEVRARAMHEIGSAMLKSGGDVKATAAYLDVSRATLHRWLAMHAYLRQALKSARHNGPA